MTSAAKIFAIGEIRGCPGKLRNLLERLPYRPGRDRLVLPGDYLDRGPDTTRTLDLFCELKERHPALVTLIGNHEYLLPEYHRTSNPALLPQVRKMGIDAILKSYEFRTGFSLKSNDKKALFRS